MRKLSKILALVLVLMMAFAVVSAFNFTTSAANLPGGTKLYLVPSANWNQSNARFAAYFFGDGEAWVSMTKVAGESNLYEVTVPAGKNFTNVIFCRMNPSASANNWNNKWNQTSDLVYNGTSNCYTVKEGTWDKGGGTWSTYGSACAHTNVGAAATCTKDQLCLDCGDPVASALGHTYNSAHLCTRCNEQASFTVAGSGAHLGTEWDTGNTANDMTYADGVYTKVYTNVAAGTYKFKVARDHDWGTAYPSADKSFTVATAGSTVTITLKGTTVNVTVEAPHTCEFVAGEVVAPTFEADGYTVYTCTCGKTENRDIVPALVAVAQIGEVKYETLAEAIAAAQAGDTVLVYEGTYAVPSMKAGITIEGVGEVLFEGTLSGTLENLTLKNIHIKGDNAQRWAYAKGDLVFENVTFEATSVYALHFDGITEGATLLYKDCTIIGWAAMSGSPASCVFDGCTIKGNGSYGLIRTYFDATIENCSFDISNVNPDDVYQDGIHAVDATVTVNNCTNVNGEMKDIIDTSKVGYVVLDGETIHIHKFEAGETVAPTYNADGYTVYTCPCGNVEHRDIVPALVAVAQVGDVKYGDLQEAIKAAAPAGTVELLCDVTVEKWIMISETLTIGDGTVITLDMNGLTIDGNGHTLTINDVESAGNGGHLFYDGDYSVCDLTLVMGENVNGLGITSGTISNVTFIGGRGTSAGAAIHVSDGIITGIHAGNVTIEGCTFKNNGGAIYFETAQNDLVVNNNTFEVPASANVILLRGTEQFTNNTVISGRTVNVVSGSPVVTGNNFGDVRLKVYNEATATISNNTINNLVFNDETVAGSVFADNTLSESAEAALEAVLPRHEHVWSDATCTEPSKCECGETQGEALGHTPGAEATCTTAQTCTVCGAELVAKLGHVDANLDIDCDREGCTSKVAPKADSVLSTFTANCLGSKVSTSSKYYVIGTIVEVLDQKNGMFLVDDGTGEKFYFRLPKNADGVSHSSWEIKLTLGDKVQLYGAINKYSTSSAPNGQYWPAMQGPVVTILEQHTHVAPETVSCTKDRYCACGQFVAEAPGHIDADTNGICDNCPWDMNLVEVNIAIGTDPKYNGVRVDDEAGKALSWTWSAGGFDAIISKGTSTVTLYTTAKDYMQLKKQNLLTIVNNDDVTVKYITISVTNATYLTHLKTALTNSGYEYTADETNFTATIQLNSAEDFVLENKASSTIYVNGVSIVYAKKGAHIHEFKETITTPATCTEAGLKTFTCECGEGTYTEVIEALGHDFVEGVCSRCEEKDPNYVPPCAHKDAGLDAKCDVCGEYFLPTSPFKLEMYQATKKETYYFTGAMSGYYFATSTDITKAVDLYAEEVEGGYNVYFMSGSTKNYLYIELSGTHINAKFGSTKAVWYVDAKYGALVTEVSGAKYFLGTYSTYVTFGGTAYTRLTDSTADVSQYIGRAVSLADHVCEGTTVVTDPTCTTQGYTTLTCDACGRATKSDYVDALGHKFFAGVCTVCEVADPDYNAYLLNFSQWPEFPKETYADGDVVKYNDIFTFIMGKNSRVDASEKTWEDFVGTLRFSFGGKTPTGAVPSKNALQITVDGAYTIKIWYVAGGDARYFALMNAEGTVLSETTNETVKNGQYYAELVIPAAGTYYLGVPADNNYIFQIELVKHEHTAGAEATCTTAQTCTVCGAELVAALGHDIVVDEAVAPTCTETGLTAGEHCSRCDHKVAQEVVDALGHSYEVAVTAPTCTSTGYTTYTCACGDTYIADEVAALEHEYVDGACTVCGKEDPNYVPHEHNFVEGKCECGAEDPNYVPPVQEPAEEAEELNFFQKILAWFTELLKKFLGIFKKKF